MAFESYKVDFSIPKFISHNGQTADPLNKFSKALKNISGKRKKTDEDFQKLSDIEAEAGLYLNEDGCITISPHVVEAAILEGARKSKEGKTSLSACWVDSVSPIEFEGSSSGKRPLTVEQVVADEKFRRVDAVRVGQAKVMRTRPYFKNVKGSFVVSLDTEAANFEQLQRWIVAAFNQVGLGDWRPRFGRGTIEKITKLKN